MLTCTVVPLPGVDSRWNSPPSDSARSRLRLAGWPKPWTLILRLRFALGEYDSDSDRPPEATAHVLRIPTEAPAVSCKNELQDSATDVHSEPDPDKTGLRLFAVYSEPCLRPNFATAL
jgi:hypothetical protein